MYWYICTDIPRLRSSRQSELWNRCSICSWNSHCLWSRCSSYGLHCHINPAITLGCLITGRISCKDSIGYICGQVVGAIIAGACLAFIYGAETGIGSNGIGAGCNGSAVTALIVEAILTALFVLVVLGATHKTNGDTGKFAGLAIGLSLILIHLVGIHFTGTSVNPARSIGPAIFAGGEALTNVWIFIVGPFIGSFIAAGLWKLVEPKE